MPSPDDTDTERGSGDDAQDSRGTLRDCLVSFLETVADADTHGTQHREGTIDRGRSTVSYEYAVTVGLPSPEEHGAEETDRPTGGDTDVVDVSTGANTEQRIETRHHGEGAYTLVADLPDAATATIEAVVDETGSELQLVMDGAVVEHIAVNPDDTTITDAAVTNGILTVRLQQTEKP